MAVAITREVSRRIADCQLTHVDRQPIDVARARSQHAEYERALERCGCTVERLPELADYPDSVFVEDAAIVLDNVAVLTRPGAASRLGEVDEIAPALARYRTLVRLDAPATLDGGDVLRLGQTLWVGRSGRTNAEGVAQLEHLLRPFGYEVRAATMRDALHLKTAVTQVADDTLLVNSRWVDARQFGAWNVLEVDPSEPFAANAVWVNGHVIHSSQFPRTQEVMLAAGVDVVAVDASELARAEGGVTCCSLLVTS